MLKKLKRIMPIIFIIMMVLNVPTVSANNEACPLSAADYPVVYPIATEGPKVSWPPLIPGEGGETILPTPTPPPSDDKLWLDQSRRVTSGKYTYHILSREKKYISILKVANPKKKVVFPKEIDGYKVVGIGQTRVLVDMNFKEAQSYQEFLDYKEIEDLRVFGEGQGNVKEITIPKCVRFIGNRAFVECSNLDKINFVKREESLRTEYMTFGLCKALSEITIPRKVEVYSTSFRECGKLKRVKVEGRITDCRGFEYTNIKKLILNNDEMENLFPVTNNKVETLVIGKNVRKVRWSYDVYGYEDEDTILPDEQNVIRKMIVCSKKTEFENISAKYQSIKKLYTIKGAKAIKWAKNNNIKYKVLSKKKLNKMCKK